MYNTLEGGTDDLLGNKARFKDTELGVELDLVYVTDSVGRQIEQYNISLLSRSLLWGFLQPESKASIVILEKRFSGS